MKHYVNNSDLMELITEIATQLTETEFKEETFNTGETTITFTEQAQDYFNDKYDEIETLFNNIAHIHSDNEQQTKSNSNILTTYNLIQHATNLQQTIKNTPNDTDLGAKVRRLEVEFKESTKV